MTPHTTLKLKVVILDEESTLAKTLKMLIEENALVDDVKILKHTQDANEALQDQFNCLIIDIFSLGVETSIAFIEHIRSKFPAVPICLYSSSELLSKMPGVNEYWMQRLSHYYFLYKDLDLKRLEAMSEQVIEHLAQYLHNAIARERLNLLRAKLSSDEGKISQAQKQEIAEIAEIAENALASKRDAPPKNIIIVPGVDTEYFERLVNETLLELKKGLRKTTTVNINVLVIGAGLVVFSFIVAVVTNRWEAVAFGGFGMAGVITSLITNPLKSISISARRLVQVQVAYLSFLSQLALINKDSEGSTIEKVRLLGDEMIRSLKALDDHFGK